MMQPCLQWSLSGAVCNSKDPGYRVHADVTTRLDNAPRALPSPQQTMPQLLPCPVMMAFDYYLFTRMPSPQPVRGGKLADTDSGLPSGMHTAERSPTEAWIQSSIDPGRELESCRELDACQRCSRIEVDWPVKHGRLADVKMSSDKTNC
jgi:hypothetical protein